MLTYPGVRAGDHRVPWEMQDTVEEVARGWGRHGRIGWVPGLNCFAVHLTRRPEDPMMREWQEGRLKQAEPPTESIPLHEWSAKEKRYVGLKLEELGPSGIRELLEKGNMWSGRGEYGSLMEAVQAKIEHNRLQREAWHEHANNVGRDIAEVGRRTAFNLPWVPVSGVPTEKKQSLTTPTTKENAQ